MSQCWKSHVAAQILYFYVYGPCYVVQYILCCFSSAVISLGKRELVVLLVLPF